VAKYMRPQRRPPSQTWRTFLTNHANQPMAADFFVVPTVTFRLLFVLVILEHDRRRFIGTARRECLDWMIPLNERHLRSVLTEWISHDNGERSHAALSPGLPNDATHQQALTGHRIPAAHRVLANVRLGGCITTICWNPLQLEFLRSTALTCGFTNSTPCPLSNGRLHSASSLSTWDSRFA